MTALVDMADPAADDPPGFVARTACLLGLTAAALIASLPEVHAATAALADHLMPLFGIEDGTGRSAEIAGAIAARLLPVVPVAAAAVVTPSLAGAVTLFVAGLAGDVSSGGALGWLALVMLAGHLVMSYAGRAMPGGSLIAGWARWAAALAVLTVAAAASWGVTALNGESDASALLNYLAGGLVAGLAYPPVALVARGLRWALSAWH